MSLKKTMLMDPLEEYLFERAFILALVDSLFDDFLLTVPQERRQFIGRQCPEYGQYILSILNEQCQKQCITLNQKGVKSLEKIVGLKLSQFADAENDKSLNKMGKLNKKGKLIELSLSNSSSFDTYCRMFSDKSHNKFKFDNIYEIVYKKNMKFKDIIIKLSQLLKNYFDPIYYELYYYSKKRSKWLKILNLEKKINQNSFKKGIFKMKFEILFYPDLYKIVSS